MKIFISWSGDYSREVAEKLSVWIPSVIQSVETFYSPVDIGKGENWSNRLSQELAECTFGIVCLTPENVSAPWIHFEAGALAKSMESRLSSIMFGITPSDIKGPLSRFQNTRFDQPDFYKLIQTINRSTEKPLQSNILEKTFNTMWNEFEEDVQKIIQHYQLKPAKEQLKGSDHEAIQEILRVVRKISNDSTRLSEIGHQSSVPIIEEYSQNNKIDSITPAELIITALGPNPALSSKFISLFSLLPAEKIIQHLSQNRPLRIKVPGDTVNAFVDRLNRMGVSYSID